MSVPKIEVVCPECQCKELLFKKDVMCRVRDASYGVIRCTQCSWSDNFVRNWRASYPNLKTELNDWQITIRENRGK